jgi:hypothetical protein
MKLTIDLADEERKALEARAHAAGLPMEGYARQVLERDLRNGSPESEKDLKPIWEVILEEMKSVPPEAFDALPTDGASQVDHYLYGHPKR